MAEVSRDMFERDSSNTWSSSSKPIPMASGRGLRFVAAYLRRRGLDLDPVLRRARIDRKQGGEHPQHRGLAGPVRAEDAEDLSLHDLEVDPVDGAEIAERLGQPRSFNCHECHLVTPRILRTHTLTVGGGGFTGPTRR